MNRVENLVLKLLDKEICQIAVRKAGSYRFPLSYRFEAHRHIEYEINYVVSGGCVMIFEEEYVPLKAGECIIVPPFCKHGFLVEFKNGCKLQQVEMSVQLPEHAEEMLNFGSGSNPYYRIKDCENIIPLMAEVARFHRSEIQNEYTGSLLDLAVVQLLVALEYHVGKTDAVTAGIKNRKIVGIMKYIQEHYYEPVQIEELAKHWSISSRYIRKYFLEEIGMSCSAYITAIRVNRAKELLWETQKSITDIALEIGYGTPQYFCRIFKNEVGMSPSVYRLSWKENDAI